MTKEITLSNRHIFLLFISFMFILLILVIYIPPSPNIDISDVLCPNMSPEFERYDVMCKNHSSYFYKTVPQLPNLTLKQ